MAESTTAVPAAAAEAGPESPTSSAGSSSNVASPAKTTPAADGENVASKVASPARTTPAADGENAASKVASATTPALDSSVSEALPAAVDGAVDGEDAIAVTPPVGAPGPAGEDAAPPETTTPSPKTQLLQPEDVAVAPLGNAAAGGEVAAVPETTPTPQKKQWGDEDFEEEPDLSSFISLKVSNDDAGDGDKTDVAVKPLTLNESVENPETEIRKILADDTPYSSAKTFEDLNLSENLLRGIYTEMNFDKPSRIQAETLPLILNPPYQNLIAQAHNGSGKTTCFVLGMLSRVDPAIKAPQALCVCPTRELAIQNEEVLLKMAKYTGITSACTASADSGPPVSSSRRGQIVDQVIIGTPGTLKRWMTKDKILNTRNIRVLVFDEADHMLDQDGFQDDSLRIIRDIKLSRGSCQILLFSATFSAKVKAFALRTVPQANYIFVEKEKLSLDVIKQYRVRCPDVYTKIEVIKDRIFPAAERLGQSIIFVRTRQSAGELHRTLEADGFRCTSIQGGLSHEERDQVIREFRSGQTKILIATDVLARGFDQAQVTLVVNYDIPTKSSQLRSYNSNDPDYELYLHRIGRSGRFGRKGAAFNLTVTDRDERNVDLIANHFERTIPEVPFDDDDAFETVLKDAGLA